MKCLATVLSVAICFLGSPAFGGIALDGIRRRGVLRVGTTGDYKPLYVA
jgi:ABC-type amino acid transport substrate-binding protein